MSASSRHVVINNDARRSAQVWEHDGDAPIALFNDAKDAHLFNAAPDLLAALQDLIAVLNPDKSLSVVKRATAAIAKATP